MCSHVCSHVPTYACSDTYAPRAAREGAGAASSLIHLSIVDALVHLPAQIYLYPSPSSPPCLFLPLRLSAAPSTPGLSPAATAVAAKAREGVVAVVEHLRTSPRDSETSRWCCDAIYTLVTGNGAARDAAHAAGALGLIIAAMSADGWHEDLQTKAVWALLAFAPSHAAEIGELGGVEALVAGMQKNSTCHDLQVSAVKLLSLLTLEPSGANLRKARMANAIPVIKTCVRAHAEDGTLLYRGVNLLERLEPGVSASMPRLNMVRSASMRAEEMVLGLKSFARQASSRTNGPSSTASASARGDGGAGGGVDAGMMAANAAAIAEVDELAEQVEEESDNEGEGKDKGKKAEAAAAAAAGSGASRSSGRTSPAPATPARVEPQPDSHESARATPATPAGGSQAGSRPQSQAQSHHSHGETVDAVTIVADSHAPATAAAVSVAAAVVEAAADVVSSAAAAVAAAAAESLPGAVNGSPASSRRDSHAEAAPHADDGEGHESSTAAEAAGAAAGAAVAAAAVVGGLAVGAAVLGAAVAGAAAAGAAADVAHAGADAADAAGDAAAAVVVAAASVAVEAAHAGAAAVEAAADEAVEAVDPSE